MTLVQIMLSAFSPELFHVFVPGKKEKSGEKVMVAIRSIQNKEIKEIFKIKTF